MREDYEKTGAEYTPGFLMTNERAAEDKADLSYVTGVNSKSEMQAVKEAVRNGLLVITGGPGTGKTTTINTIIRYFEMEGMDIFLAAPTGRAAKRMSETTGFEARTDCGFG